MVEIKKMSGVGGFVYAGGGGNWVEDNAARKRGERNKWEQDFHVRPDPKDEKIMQLEERIDKLEKALASLLH